MFPVDFAYTRARDLDHALAVLAEGNEDDVKVLAGGQSLLPLMKLRLATPATLLDVVNFYDQRFSIGLTDQAKHDLVAFLEALGRGRLEAG